MQTVSAAFLAAMENTPYIARLTLDGTDTIQGNAVPKFSFSGGSNANEDGITLGTTVASAVTITLEKEDVTCTLESRELFLEIGIEIGSETEWLPMGTFKVTDAAEDDGNLVITASDALSSKFDVEYEPIEGFDFDADGGVDSVAFLVALCFRRGVKVDTSGLESIPLESSPEGYTERQIIGFIAALHSGFANIDRNGVLRIRWYEAADYTVDPDAYYANGMEKASFDFNVGWVKCYVEPMAETLAAGDTSAAQGIYFECPWMTEEILEGIWTKVKGFTYRPVTELRFFGDPRLDPWDIITMEDLSGTSHSVPAMAISHEYDGGIISRITASGQAKTEAYEGPVQRETKRLYSRIIKRQNEIELSINSLDGDKIISMINLSDTTALIQAPKIKFEGLVTANSNFKILEDGSVEAAKITATGGTIGGCQIVDGKLQIGRANITEKLTADDIDATNLKVSSANITGTITANSLKVVNSSGATLLSAGDNAVVIGGWNIASNGLYNTSSGRIHLVASGNMSTGHAVGDSGSKTNWRILCGSSSVYNFGVDSTGVAYAKDIKIYGGKVKIPIDSVTGAYALIDLGGIGCYASDGTGVVMTETGLLYDGDYVMSFDSGKRLLEGTWYIGSLSSSVQVTSDRNAKYDIQDQPEIYSQLFDQLKPVTYKYKDGTSGRIHTGFIAQDVENAVLSLGLETADFAAVCYDLDEAGNKVRYGVRYEEIVSLNTYEIQQLKKRVADLETLIRT